MRPEVNSVLRIVHGGTKPAKDLRSICNRRIHFLYYCKKRHLLDGLFSLNKDDTAKIQPPTQLMLNYAMACYAIFLSTGHTLRAKNVKADTIRVYLKDSATLLQQFDDTDRDARKIPGEKFEKVPDRREPFTHVMLRLHKSKCAFDAEDSLRKALSDWFTVGLSGGYRRAEWCQDRHNYTPGREEYIPESSLRDLGRRVKAFTLSDIQFFDKNGSAVSTTIALAMPKRVVRIGIHHAWQKNGDHGETKYVHRNNTTPSICSVQAWIRIVRRYVDLRDPKITNAPLAIFRDKKRRQVSNITSDLVELEMRSLAKELYGIKTEKGLLVFSCHSLRVGACCALYLAGLTPAEIKRTLRWKSDSWELYIRDLGVIAKRVNRALTAADELPNIF